MHRTQRMIIVMTTVANRTDARRISKALLDMKLTACVQTIGPIESSYVWKQKTVTTREFMLMIKARERAYRRIESMIKAIHKYDIPEIFSIHASNVGETYLDWLHMSTTD